MDNGWGLVACYSSRQIEALSFSLSDLVGKMDWPPVAGE